jgi:hypothetical protein
MQFSGPLVSLTQAKVVVKLPDGDKTFSFNANTKFCVWRDTFPRYVSNRRPGRMR